MPQEAFAAFPEHNRREAERKHLFGLGKPIVSIDNEANGYRIVGVGNTALWSKNWQTFHEFLFYNITRALSADFGNRELAKPFDQRHPVLQWYEHVCAHKRKTVTQQGVPAWGISTGPVQSYMSLAYDLFTVEDNATLHAQLVRRIQNKDQFHGAIHELKVIASFIRAGFDIEFENERDEKTTHHEFSGLHRASQKSYSSRPKRAIVKACLGKPGKSSTERHSAPTLGVIFRGRSSSGPFIPG